MLTSSSHRILTSSIAHIFISSHPHIFISSHPHILTSSQSHLFYLHLIHSHLLSLRHLYMFSSLCFMLFDLHSYISYYTSLRSRALRRLVQMHELGVPPSMETSKCALCIHVMCVLPIPVEIVFSHHESSTTIKNSLLHHSHTMLHISN